MTQRRLWSPVVLNGSGFGLFANHSLVMALHMTRARDLAAALAERLAEGGPEGVTLEEAESWTLQWQRDYRRYWRKSACEPGAAHGLARQTLARLAALGLVRRQAGQGAERILPLPALGRFRVGSPALPGTPDNTQLDPQPDLAESAR